eukprot:2652864-Prymnesium_polylepis.1
MHAPGGKRKGEKKLAGSMRGGVWPCSKYASRRHLLQACCSHSCFMRARGAAVYKKLAGTLGAREGRPRVTG